MFTDRSVRALKPLDKPKYYCDGNGLYLLVSKVGTKSWLFRTQRAGARWITIGRYPEMSLLTARNKAQELTELDVAHTVERAYSEFEKTIQRDFKRPDHIQARFQKDILPALKLTTPLVKITRNDVSNLLQDIVKRGSPIQANRTLPDIKRFFSYCVERGWIKENPADAITTLSVGGKERSRDRTLSVEEIKELIKILLTDRFYPSTRIALALLLITGQRSGEVLGITRSEVNGRWWHIPAARTKSGRLQKVYLSPQAAALLRIAFNTWGRSPFACDHRTLDRATKRMVTFDPPFTPHDLRRTMSTRLPEDHGIMPHVLEKMLNHSMQGTMAVYNRAEYLNERRDAWRIWGAWLANLRRGLREKTMDSSSSVADDRLCECTA